MTWLSSIELEQDTGNGAPVFKADVNYISRENQKADISKILGYAATGLEYSLDPGMSAPLMPNVSTTVLGDTAWGVSLKLKGKFSKAQCSYADEKACKTQKMPDIRRAFLRPCGLGPIGVPKRELVAQILYALATSGDGTVVAGGNRVWQHALRYRSTSIRSLQISPWWYRPG